MLNTTNELNVNDFFSDPQPEELEFNKLSSSDTYLEYLIPDLELTLSDVFPRPIELYAQQDDLLEGLAPAGSDLDASGDVKE